MRVWGLLSVILNTCDRFGLCSVLLFAVSSGFDLVVCYCLRFVASLILGWLGVGGWSLFSCWLWYVCCCGGV